MHEPTHSNHPSPTRVPLGRRLCAHAAALFLGVLATTVVASVQEPAQAPSPAGAAFALANGPGVDVFQRVCLLCHPADRVVAARRTKTEWAEVIDKMVERGAQVTDDNYGPIEEYLLRHYSKVNVNRAVKEDLILIAGTAAADAEAILKHRAEHGPFADFEALSKVAGIDVKKLEEKKDAITF